MKASNWTIAILLLAVAFGCDQETEDEVRSVQTFETPQQLESEQVQRLPGNANANDDANIPDQPVSGKLMGRPFHPDGFEISDAGHLELRVGKRGFPDAMAGISLCLGFSETPAGRTYEFHPGDAGKYCPSVVLSQKTGRGLPDQKSFRDGYRLKLRFGEPREHMLSGHIFLRVPGEDTEFTGVFHVAEPENQAQPPEERHRPHVYGRIGFLPPSPGMLVAGYAGIGDDGNIYTNGAGMELGSGESLGGGSVTSTSFKPRNTTLWTDENGTPFFRHVRLEPGTYVFAISWEGNLIFHRWLQVEEDATLRWDPVVDLDSSGAIVVEAPKRRVTVTQGIRQEEPIWLLPLDSFAGIPNGVDERKIWRLSFGLQIKPVDEVDKVTYRFLAPGSYQVRYKDQVKTAEVASGEEVKIRFR